jgi:hypothetical protein
MSDPKPFDPFDPISAAMGAMHQGNLLQAEQAKQKAVTYAGNELARVMEDILGSDMITCQISRAVMTASLAKWQKAKTGQ